MENAIKLTAEELYYLGGQMQAKYIDYDYISAMGDIQKNYRMYESNAVDGLAGKGLIEEDFSGEITVSVSIEELLALYSLVTSRRKSIFVVYRRIVEKLLNSIRIKTKQHWWN